MDMIRVPPRVQQNYRSGWRVVVTMSITEGLVVRYLVWRRCILECCGCLRSLMNYSAVPAALVYAACRRLNDRLQDNSITSVLYDWFTDVMRTGAFETRVLLLLSHCLAVRSSEHVQIGFQFLPRDALLARSSYVRPSVCLSHAGIVPKWLNLGSCKQRYAIARGF